MKFVNLKKKGGLKNSAQQISLTKIKVQSFKYNQQYDSHRIRIKLVDGIFQSEIMSRIFQSEFDYIC